MKEEKIYNDINNNYNIIYDIITNEEIAIEFDHYELEDYYYNYLLAEMEEQSRRTVAVAVAV